MSNVNEINLDTCVRGDAPQENQMAIQGLLDKCVAQATWQAAKGDLPNLAALGVTGDSGERYAARATGGTIERA